MAEFCLDCFNKMFKTKCKRRHVELDYDLCEECGEWKKCIVTFKRKADIDALLTCCETETETETDE